MEKKLQDYLDSEYKRTGKEDLRLTIEELKENHGHWDINRELGNSSSEDYKLVEGQKVYKVKTHKMKLENKDDKHKKVAIDFGTKSTTVGYFDNKNIFRALSLGDNETENENPTILYINNIEQFQNDYNSSARRPETNFDDLKFARKAEIERENSSITNISDSSFFSNIKQWANKKIEDDSYRDYILDNHSKNVVKLKPLRLINPTTDELFNYKENFNPLEIYAYLIGSIVNNSKKLDIYSKFYMSYPVSTKLDIRNKIALSFKKGLERTIPDVEDDKGEVGNIKIMMKCSEPLAYTVAVLDQLNIALKYGSQTEYKDNIFYSTFDFGGGTSDYSYGIVKKEKSKDGTSVLEIEEIFNYGDRYLGGENILKGLIYSVITNDTNFNEFRDKGIQFFKYKVSDETIKVKYNSLFTNEEIGKKNLIILEKIFRPIMENIKYIVEIEDYDQLEMEQLNIDDEEIFDIIKEIKSSNQFTISFENKEVNIKVSIEELSQYMEKLIRTGVRNFIQGLKVAFNKIGEKISKIDDRYILLGGNASKSKLFQQILKEEIVDSGNQLIEDMYENIINPLNAKDEDMRNNYYKKKWLMDSKDKDLLPTAKTGVLYGMLRLQQIDSGIKLIKGIAKKEIPFLYNVLTPNYKKDSVLNFFTENIGERNQMKSKWVKYYEGLDCENETVSIIYTNFQYTNETKPKIEILENELVTMRYSIDTYLEDEDEDEEFTMWLRIVDPETLEYRILPSNETPSDEEEADKYKFLILGE